MAQILLVSGGSVAIHKACDLASKLTQEGHRVRAILTRSAAKLVSPQLFEALTGEPVSTEEFGPTRRTAMDHIELAKWGELLLVAPASASLIARLAHGMADDLVGTVALALDAKRPRILCPAMNPIMLQAAAVQRNIARLSEDGWEILDPEEGHMACGDAGKGRLPDPQKIIERVAQRLARAG